MFRAGLLLFIRRINSVWTTTGIVMCYIDWLPAVHLVGWYNTEILRCTVHKTLKFRNYVYDMVVDVSDSILFVKKLKFFNCDWDLRKQVAFSRVLTTGAPVVWNVRLNLIHGSLLAFFLSFNLLIGWQLSFWNCCKPFFHCCIIVISCVSGDLL